MFNDKLEQQDEVDVALGEVEEELEENEFEDIFEEFDEEDE